MQIQNLLLAFSSIKSKKVQSFFVFIVIIISALSFSVAYAILVGMDSPFEKMNNKLKGSHLTIMINSNVYDKEAMAKWWGKQEKVESVSALSPFMIINSPRINDKAVDEDIYLCELIKAAKEQDKLLIVEGEQKKEPASGEIWLPTSFAYEKNIKVGDILSVDVPNKKVDFKVSAIVVDPVFSVPMLNPVRVWCKKDTLKNEFKDIKLKNYFLGIRFVNRSDEGNLWNKFEKSFKKTYGGAKYKYEDLEAGFLFSFKLIGVFMIVFAFVLVFITYIQL